MNIDSNTTQSERQAAPRRRSTRATSNPERARRRSTPQGLSGVVRGEVSALSREAQRCLSRPSLRTCGSAAVAGAGDVVDGLEGIYGGIRNGMRNNPAELSPLGTTVRQPGDTFSTPAGA